MVKVERGMMFGKVLPFVLLSAFAVSGCGGDDKKDEDSEDSQYVVMPFSLGDMATVNGASETTFSISKAAAAAAGAGLKGTENFDALYMNDVVADHEARSLLNHFDASRGLDQGEWFWSTARRLDAYHNLQTGNGAHFFTGTETGPVESMYRSAATAPKQEAKQKQSYSMTTATLAGACPTDITNGEVERPLTPSTSKAVEIPEGGVEDGTDYCLVYVDDPVTAGDRAAVKATVKTVIERYKTVIYNDAFAAVGDYIFKPIVVVIDFGDATKWPTDDGFQISGAFIGKIGDDNYHQPVLYMASNNKNLKKNKDTPDAEFDKANATKVWHGTVAHEMQHAVMDYFKSHKAALGGEIPSIDEGLAHFMEDLFGYGQENFGGFAKSFLSIWANPEAGGFPILHASETGASNRGAAHAFWYYLVSQKGGVTFSSGAPAAGAGLDFVAAAVKSGKRGVANLNEQFGGTWTDTVAGFYGALVLDGTKVPEGLTVDAKYKVQDLQTITDLTGNTDKQFGMHFNGFQGIADTRTYTLTTETTTKIEDVSFYQTVPLLYTGTGVDALNYVSEGEDKANFGVAKIKIK